MQTNSLGGHTQVIYFGVILVIFIVIMYRRANIIMKGRKLSNKSLIRLPLIYTVLTAFFLYDVGILFIVLSIVLYLTAIIPGYLLAKETKIFKKEKEQYYKSSIIITVIWVALFIVRIGIEFFSPENLLLEGVTAVLLAFSAGLFVGEGLLIRNRLKINLG
ncbi:MAG: conserved hypothetical membrane protein [Candidatus Parvarchaeum acidophilus ARMAN-5]|jgi:membrane protein CcdC involved in cytochrome C biogenesis|uniref:Conserved hypothetical membrane protein n=1 Tax=Candidatus Parvarchaeum acidophilus ARMAN-5 TaxID=662762 RepID=D6GUQ0_PARA5|nr:MAG: conserved hypothetical membrane protein [Candidatus Parvarchaeum acidophilus ARMAN-5]